MGYYQLEPFGEMVADRRHAVAVQTFANANRNPKDRPTPYLEKDFIRWGELGEMDAQDEEAILLEDPDEQSALIAARIFGTSLPKK
ncbi:hypothetical protein [Herbaspirillum sp. NPDC101396]|uniref:phage tail assembly protein T n=1 Tax=Herbaspirillum sp. NPDC101396 TaxID=3364005 RepID=UPI00383B8B38